MAIIVVSKGQYSSDWALFPSTSTAPIMMLGMWWALSEHLWSDRKNEYREGTLFFLERVDDCEGGEMTVMACGLLS